MIFRRIFGASWPVTSRSGRRRESCPCQSVSRIVPEAAGRGTLVGAFEANEATVIADQSQLAAINSIILSGAERQVFAYDLNFVYRTTQSGFKRGYEFLNDDLLRRHYRERFSEGE